MKARSADTGLGVCSSVLRKTKGLPCAHEMHYMLMSARRLQLTDFDKYWHILPGPSFKVKPSDGTRRPQAGKEVGTTLLTRLTQLQLDLPCAHWEQLAERTADALEQDLSSKPTVLKNPTLLLTSKGRPTESQTRKRAAAGLATRKSLTGRIKGSDEMKRRKCGLCGRVNSGHDRRNCPQKQLQAASNFLLPPVDYHSPSATSSAASSASGSASFSAISSTMPSTLPSPLSFNSEKEEELEGSEKEDSEEYSDSETMLESNILVDGVESCQLSCLQSRCRRA